MSTSPFRLLSWKKITEVLDQWAPKFATIALFTRWAKRSTTHYNTDSISLVETIAKQAGISPLDVLEQLKTYRFSKSLVKPYGFKFLFASIQAPGGALGMIGQLHPQPNIEASPLRKL